MPKVIMLVLCDNVTLIPQNEEETKIQNIPKKKEKKKNRIRREGTNLETAASTRRNGRVRIFSLHQNDDHNRMDE